MLLGVKDSWKVKIIRLDIRNGKKVFTETRYDANKNSVSGGGEGKPDKKCFRCGHTGHMRADCNAKTHVNGGPPQSAPKRRTVGNCEEEKNKKSCKMCR